VIERSLYHRYADANIVEAVQFNIHEDYFEIVEWMKRCGDTWALAGEIMYSTPEMSIHGGPGRMTARPGDWIVRDTADHFTVCRDGEFQKLHEYIRLSLDSLTCLGGAVHEENMIDEAVRVYADKYASEEVKAFADCLVYDRNVVNLDQPTLYGFVGQLEHLAAISPPIKGLRLQIYSVVASNVVGEMGADRFVELVAARH
jgi:hypothetical protein